MNPWEILGIEATTDNRKIKKAYAKKLRMIIPDEQPEKFQTLKAAFDTALLLAKKNDDTQTVELGMGELFFDREENENQLTEAAEDGRVTERLFSVELQLLLNNKEYAYNLTLWKELTESIDEWSIDEFMSNTYSIQLFLIEYFRRLSREVIHFLFHKFELLELNDVIGQENYVVQDFIRLKNEIYRVPAFSFTIASTIEDAVREEYFDLRYSIYCMIQYEEDRYVIENMLDRAKQLFSKDSDLFNLSILTILQAYHGYTMSDLNLKRITGFIEQAEVDQKNETTKFLKSYVIALKMANHNQVFKETISSTKEQLIIPEKLYTLLMGYYFFFKQQYTAAFELWKKLPLKELNYLNDPLKKMEKQLPAFKMQEYLELTKKVKNFQKKGESTKETPWLSNKKMMWPLYLAIAILFFKVILLGGATSNKLSNLEIERSNTISNYLKEKKGYKTVSLVDDSLERSFIETFYLSDQVADKEQFKNDYMEESASIDSALQLNNLPKFQGASLSDFSLRQNEMDEYTVIYFKGEPVNINRLSSQNDQKLYDLYGEGWARMDEYLPIGLDDLALPVDSFAETFVYSFYLTNNPLLKDVFRLDSVYDDALKEQMRDFTPAESYQESSINDFSFITKQGEGSIKIVYIAFKEHPFCTIAYYDWASDDNLIGLVGDQWNYQASDMRYPLRVIDYEQSAKLFIQYILYSDQKQENLVKYQEYFSENMKTLIENRLSLTPSENLKNTDLYYSLSNDNSATNKEPLLFLGYGEDARMFFTFDSMGRLDHVYAEQWESGMDRKGENNSDTHIQSLRGILKEKQEE